MPTARSIAVIDDDELVRLSMSSLIRSMGLRAQTFPSADAFLASGETGFACLVCDVHMPGTSGLQLQGILMSWDERPPMVLMSGHPEGMRGAALECGASGYISKPVDCEVLISLLEDILGNLP